MLSESGGDRNQTYYSDEKTAREQQKERENTAKGVECVNDQIRGTSSERGSGLDREMVRNTEQSSSDTNREIQ